MSPFKVIILIIPERKCHFSSLEESCITSITDEIEHKKVHQKQKEYLQEERIVEE